MIKFVTGDMFAEHYDARVNPVNVVGTMGAGLALKFKRQYPGMFEVYARQCKLGHISIGHVWVWNDKDTTGDIVVNFPTKKHWKEPSQYEYIETGLDSLLRYLNTETSYLAMVAVNEQEPEHEFTVAVPALGCGYGGLDFDRVKKMIETQLASSSAIISVFEPKEKK